MDYEYDEILRAALATLRLLRSSTSFYDKDISRYSDTLITLNSYKSRIIISKMLIYFNKLKNYLSAWLDIKDVTPSSNKNDLEELKSFDYHSLRKE